MSLSLAKDQRLSLNPSQISGGCGRLLCCLRYEHDFYVATRKRFPKEGKTISTAVGRERVQAVDIFRERVLLRSEDGTFRTVMLVDLKAEVAAATDAPQGRDVAPPPEQVTIETEAPMPVDETPAEEPAAPSEGGRRRRRRRRRGRRGRNGDRSNDTGTTRPEGSEGDPVGE